MNPGKLAIPSPYHRSIIREKSINPAKPLPEATRQYAAKLLSMPTSKRVKVQLVSVINQGLFDIEIASVLRSAISEYFSDQVAKPTLRHLLDLPLDVLLSYKLSAVKLNQMAEKLRLVGFSDQDGQILQWQSGAFIANSPKKKITVKVQREAIKTAFLASLPTAGKQVAADTLFWKHPQIMHEVAVILGFEPSEKQRANNLH